MQKIKRISFRTKLIFMVEFFLITATIAFGFLVYLNIRTLTREALQNKLIAIASSTASVLNAQEINNFKDEKDTQTLAYQKTQEILKQITTNNEDVDDIYIMSKGEREDIWHFIASASPEDIDSNNNGTIEDNEQGVDFKQEFSVTDFPEMKQAFEAKIADKEISCDSWGCWLSGYAPILDSQGNALAIVGVDISAQDVINYEKRLQISLLTIFGLIATISPIFLFFYLRHITDPFLIIIKSLDKFSTNLSTRINIKSKDEFGIIAESFNKMATKLDYTIKNIEAEVKERTKEIAQEKNKTELILKSIGDGVFVVDKEMKIIMFNKIAEKITGFKSQEVLGKKINEIVKLINPETGDERDTCLIEETLKTGRIQKSSGPTLLITKNKTNVPIAKSASPLKDKQDNIFGCVVVFRDITHEYEVDRAKTEFVSLASHQLRTPLSSINWYTEILLDGDLGTINTKQREYLDQIYQGNQRMIELVNSLLNVSRLEMGTFIIEPQETNIFEIADNVIIELTPKLKEKEIKVSTIYDHEITNLQVDPKLIRIIFQNLLSNSLKYNKNKETIELEISKDNKNFNIRVTDNGLGIPKNQQKLIFSKFFRADNVRQTETEGTGLGLYLVKKIIDSVSGKISFVSKKDKGTTFIVSLPLSGMQAKKGTKEIINVKK